LLVPICVGVTLCVPPVALVPLQPLLAVHEVALVEDQLSVALFPSVIEVGVTDRATVGNGGLVTVNAADATKLPPVPLQVSV
jgi:hypothetical protein